MATVLTACAQAWSAPKVTALSHYAFKKSLAGHRPKHRQNINAVKDWCYPYKGRGSQAILERLLPYVRKAGAEKHI